MWRLREGGRGGEGGSCDEWYATGRGDGGGEGADLETTQWDARGWQPCQLLLLMMMMMTMMMMVMMVMTTCPRALRPPQRGVQPAMTASFAAEWMPVKRH